MLELLVVTAILATAIGAIVACFSAGTRVWAAAVRHGGVEQETCIGLTIFEKDLRNTVAFHNVPFEGAAESMCFPAVVMSPETRGGDDTKVWVERLATVCYAYDREARALVRREEVFPGSALPGRVGEAVINGLDEVQFEYLRLGPGADPQSEWQSEWRNPTNTPVGVRVTLQLEGSCGALTLERMVILPCVEPRAGEGRTK